LPWKKPEIRYTPMRQKVESSVFLPATANLFALGICWAGFTTFVSACDRFRWRTIGIVVATYIVQMALKILGTAASEWGWLKNLSVFTAYEPEAFVHIATESPAHAWSLWLEKPIGTITFWGPLGYDLLLLALGYLAYLLAAIIFHRRDLPAPL
jgi:ABC-2 type transport system permease protein